MLGLFDWLKIGLGAVAEVAIVALPVYLTGKAADRAAQLEAGVDASVKREGIEDEVDGLDRYCNCLDLGGCQTNATGCAGWRKPPRANDPAALVQYKEAIARYLVTTDRFDRPMAAGTTGWDCPVWAVLALPAGGALFLVI